MEKLVNPGGGGGGALPYLKMMGNFHSIDPGFDIFWSYLVPFLCHTWSYWPPLCAEKIFLSPSHYVPEIIWLKVCITFLLHFLSCWPPFSLLLDLFDSSFSQNLRSHWVHFFHCMLDTPSDNLVKRTFLLPWAYEMITYSCLFSYQIGSHTWSCQLDSADICWYFMYELFA